MSHMQISEAIENLYTVFAKYTTTDMHYCDCGCIDENEVKKLASKKLQELNEEDLAYYHGSALYTWGDVEHYKHFLARILEVFHQTHRNGLIVFFEITTKLEYAKWKSWEAEEIKAIKDFVFADWINYISNENSGIDINDLEYYAFFFAPQDLLLSWDLRNRENSIRNFVLFFYYHGAELINNRLKAKDEILKKAYNHFINQKDILDLLEEEFFQADDTEEGYAAKVSAVLQMIEQEKRLAYTN